MNLSSLRLQGNRLTTVLLAIFNFSFLLFNCGYTAAHPPLGIAYVDADHLYDTIPSPFYDDTDYTPTGKLRWSGERYRLKIARTAALLDSMALPIVALWSVENENVVRDLATASKCDYVYLHRTLNSLDGMDFALLYYGDLFYPHFDEPGRRYLYVEGVLRHGNPPAGDTVGLVLCSDARMARWVVDDLRDERPSVKLIVMGRIPPGKLEACGLRDVTTRAERTGRGNVRRSRGWTMRDRILLDTALRSGDGEVFARRYLVDQKSGLPLATYEKGRYRGGFGYALPVYVYIE